MNTFIPSRFVVGLIAVIGLAQAHGATIAWDGEAGDGLWHSARNWSGDAVPGGGDDVVVSGASVTATASVRIRGFRLIGIGALRVTGRDVQFIAEGAGEIASSTITADSGALIALPSLTRVTNKEKWGGAVADGVGSVIDLSGVSVLEGNETWGTAIQAKNGGRVVLDGLEEILLGRVTLSASGESSRVESSGGAEPEAIREGRVGGGWSRNTGTSQAELRGGCQYERIRRRTFEPAVVDAGDLPEFVPRDRRGWSRQCYRPVKGRRVGKQWGLGHWS